MQIKARLSPSRPFIDNALQTHGVATTATKPRKRLWDGSAGGERQSSQQTSKPKRLCRGEAPAISPVVPAATLADKKGEAITEIDHPEIRDALRRIFSRSSFDLFILIWTHYLDFNIGLPSCENSPSWPKVILLPELENVYTYYTRLMSTLSAPACSQKLLCCTYLRSSCFLFWARS